MNPNTSSRPRWGLWLFFLLTIGALVLAAVGVLAAYQFSYAERIYPGVQVAGISLRGATLSDATVIIADELTPYPGTAVTLYYGERTWLLSPGDLGVAIDARATASAAYAVGRQSLTGASGVSGLSGLARDLASQWQALRVGTVVSPTLRFDESRLAFTLRRITQEVDLPPREGSLAISGLEVSAVPGENGRRVNAEATRRALIAAVKAGGAATVELVVEERRPSITSVQEAADRARGLLKRRFTLIADGLEGAKRFAVDPAALRQWLSFVPVTGTDGTVELSVQLYREPIRSLVQQIGAEIDRRPYDALLDFDPKNGEIVVLRSSQPGQQLDVETSLGIIEAAVMADPAAQSAEISGSQEITLPVQILPPKVDSSKIAEMGIVEQVSEGTTYFKGSSAERVHNIVNAADKLRGAVVPPGEQFSFYAWVGDVSTANGFVDSLIIVGDRTEVGVGGGVCQVSTTVFRAAFWGGFPVVERYPHSYVVSWYGEPGMDASIYTPTADFRFLNDSGHYILIQPEIDLKRGRLTFHIYGSSTRTVEAERLAPTNVREAPKPAYREDSTLPTGTIKQVDWAKEGMDVVVKRTTKYQDGRVKSDQFVSRYRPWQAVYLYGPGTQLPPEALGEPTPTAP